MKKKQKVFWGLIILKNRLVCECFDIYVDDIKKALKNGASTFEELEESMRLGVLCSGCVNDSKNIIKQLNIELGRNLSE